MAGARAGGDPGQDAGGARLLNDRSRQIVGADLLSVPGFVTPAGLTGRGQVVAVADSGIDKGSTEDIHPDLVSGPGKKPRIIMLRSWAGRDAADDPSGHGTHVAGTIVGSGAASGGKFKGLAPEASLYFQGILDREGKISPPAELDRLFLPAYLAGARIHVNAWGSEYNGYSGNAAGTDAFIRRHPDFLVIFGAGNSGPGPGTLTAEANSKNALAVGSSLVPRPALDPSSGDTLDTAPFSSRGPAGDGRIKPDLAAPGASVISTRSSLAQGNLPGHPMYTRMQGSSMSAAVAAGSAALLREFMVREMGVDAPRASSLKAALINGARSPKGGPSKEGFGVLDLAGSVMALKEKTMLLAEENSGLPRGGRKKYTYKVENPSSPLKITLAWTDPAGDPPAKKSLVNDLDLSVTSPDGKVRTGNDFLGQQPDGVNNVEQVHIEYPLPGEYVIEVKASSVKHPAAEGSLELWQDYSLAYGQPLATGIIREVSPGGVISLYGGGRVDPGGKKVRHRREGAAEPERDGPGPGHRVYYGGGALYTWGRLWSPESVLAREGPGGRIWLEAGGEILEGGYRQSSLAEKGLTVNGTYREDTAGLPPGIGLEAVIDGPTQTLWRVVSNYLAEKGNVARVSSGTKGETRWVQLFNSSERHDISPGALYLHHDTFEETDPLETAFGSGGLDGLENIMPGQQVTLISPSAGGAVNSILVNRHMVLGPVTAVSPGENRISIGPGPPFQVFSGAGVQKDRSPSSLKDIFPGDYAVAVKLPGAGTLLGIAAYSGVIYGKVLFTGAKEEKIYINDLQGRFQAYKLGPGAEVRRWGLLTGPWILSPGTWVRAVLSPDLSEVWRLDVADLLEDETKILSAAQGRYLWAADGRRYPLSPHTAVTRDGLPVTAGDLLPGEKITLVSLLAPPPYRSVPVEVRAWSAPGAKKPVFMAAALEENGQLVLAGYTSGDRLYIWHENGLREDVPLAGGTGSFRHPLRFAVGEGAVRVVTVDGAGGAVAGKTISRRDVAPRHFTDTEGHWAGGAIASTAASGIMAGYGDGAFRPDRPLAGAELAVIGAVLAGQPPPAPVAVKNPGETIARAPFMVWLKKTLRPRGAAPAGAEIPFRDCGALTGEEREAVAWGFHQGIIKGRSSQVFDPRAPLTRAEAAAVLSALGKGPNS